MPQPVILSQIVGSTSSFAEMYWSVECVVVIPQYCLRVSVSSKYSYFRGSLSRVCQRNLDMSSSSELLFLFDTIKMHESIATVSVGVALNHLLQFRLTYSFIMFQAPTMSVIPLLHRAVQRFVFLLFYQLWLPIINLGPHIQRQNCTILCTWLHIKNVPLCTMHCFHFR